MAKRYMLTVNDLTGKRLCVLYDSWVEQDGSAHDIKIKKQISGWKEVEFSLETKTSTGEKNYRVQFIRNENNIHLYEDDEEDVYCIKEPSISHTKSGIQLTVNCNHLSEELKTKSLYRSFDDENGIGKCKDLIEEAIIGSGWHLGHCDTFIEADGSKEKIRSYSCDTKTGAYEMINGICTLFDARPVFDGLTRTIDIYALQDTDGAMEVLYGRNSDSITRKLDSSNLVTRLYVEGEYEDYGYVGIDDVNPTGLNFLLNFDYYKELGFFGDAEEAALQKYIEDSQYNKQGISQMTQLKLEALGVVLEGIGRYRYIMWDVSEGPSTTSPVDKGPEFEDGDEIMGPDDQVIVINPATSDLRMPFKIYKNSEVKGSVLTNAAFLLRVVPTTTGKIAIYEDKIKARDSLFETTIEKLNKYFYSEYVDDDEHTYEHDITIDRLKVVYGSSLSNADADDYDASKLPDQYADINTRRYTASIGKAIDANKEDQKNAEEMMYEVVAKIVNISAYDKLIKQFQQWDAKAEEDFVEAMGLMLRDGYYSNDQYVPGQESALYNDALEIIDKLSKPAVTYSVNVIDLSELEGFSDEAFKMAQAVRMYDPDIPINDYGVVSEMVLYPDKPKSNSITINTDLKEIGRKSFTSILSRITEITEEMRRNKDIYERAVAISKDGTINSSILEGAIDTMKTKILSTASNWQTDDKGNLLFTALDGESAMMLSGAGLLIANSKLPNGDWNWRSAGTGDGFSADTIVTGYLNAERIEAKTITTNHLSSEVGENLDLSSNKTININAKNINIGDFTEEQMSELADGVESHISLGADQIDFKGKTLNFDGAKIDFTAAESFKVNADQLNIDASDLNLSLGGNVQVESGANIDFSSANVTFSADQIQAFGDNLNLKLGENVSVAAGEDIDFTSSGKIRFNAANVEFGTKNFNSAVEDIANTPIGTRNYILKSRSLNGDNVTAVS